MTDVFERTTEAIDAPESYVQSINIIRLCNQALMTKSYMYLQSIQHNNINMCKGMTVDTFIKVLEHMLIVVPVQDTKYFMPSLLECRDSSEIVRPRYGGAAAIKIRFSREHVPTGVLCCLIVYMLSSQGIF